MNKKLKSIIVLLISCFLSSCNKDVLIAGDTRLANSNPKTVMKIELNKAAYNINDVSVKLYLGFSEISKEYDMTYCIYIENEWVEFAEISPISDYTNVKNHTFVTSYTDEKAVELFPFTVKNTIVNYSNYIDLKIDNSCFKYERNDIRIKVIGFIKTEDNNYKINNVQANRLVRFSYAINQNEVYLSPEYDALPAFY